MRILHVVTRSQRRGAETAALELARGLDALGHENTVVALQPAFDGGTTPGLPVLVDRRRGGVLTSVRAIRALRRTLRREDPDVVLAHGGGPTQVAALARRRGGPPVVWQRILDFPPGFWRSPARRWWQVLVRRIAAAVALTRANEAELRRLGFARPVWVIPNFRDPQRLVAVDREEAATSLRAELGLPPAVPLVGLVGSLVAQKRPERALDVLEGIHARGEAAFLVVAGSGPLRATLEDSIRARDLGHHVAVLGHRDDVPRLLGGLDVVLLTSDAEGIPGIAIEALMAGCPVVTFPLGGVSEVVDDGRTGIVLAEADVGGMADAVARLLREPATRARLGAEGRRRAPEFATDRAAATYAARFDALVGRARPGHRYAETMASSGRTDPEPSR